MAFLRAWWRRPFTLPPASHRQARTTIGALPRASIRRLPVGSAVRPLRHILIIGLAAAAATVTAEAQVLNQLEVQRLVDRADSASHAALQQHFIALAAQFDREAARDQAVAHGFVGNPVRPMAPVAGTAWMARAASARAAADAVRRLAHYHEQRAAGLMALMPPRAADFEGGNGAPVPTAAQVREIEAAARTPAEHHFLMEYFSTVAMAQLETIARDTARRAAYLASVSHDPIAIADCDRRIATARRAVDAAIAAAERHHNLANAA